MWNRRKGAYEGFEEEGLRDWAEEISGKMALEKKTGARSRRA